MITELFIMSTISETLCYYLHSGLFIGLALIYFPNFVLMTLKDIDYDSYPNEFISFLKFEALFFKTNRVS